MGQSLSFSSQGAIPKKSIFGNTGILSTVTKSAGFQQPQNMSMGSKPVTPTLGTNPGVINQPKPTTPVKSVTTPDGNKTEYHAPAVNKTPTSASTSQPTEADLTAKMKGILGDSYGMNPAQYNAGTGTTSGLLNPEPPKPVAPVITGSPLDQAQNVSNAGMQTPQEKSASDALLKSGQQTDLEKYYTGLAMDARNRELYGQVRPYAQAGDYSVAPGDVRLPNLDELTLTGNAAARNGLYNNLAGIYSNTAMTGLNAAQTQANRAATVAGQAYTGAQTQAGRDLTAQTGILNSSLPITGIPYGTQNINPLTGQPLGATGGITVDPNNPVSSLPSLADAVLNGQMDINTANSQLGGNLGLTTQLRNAILAKNPNFNFNQSISSAQTQATGQQLKANVDSANKALDTLTTSFNSLPGLQTGGIPLSNSIAQWIGNQLGQGALSQYLTNLHDARSQLVGVLNSSGGTPTGNEATAQSYLPDNMTKAQFDANVGTPEKPGIVRELMNQKLTSFSGSGSQNISQPSGSSTGGSIWDF